MRKVATVYEGAPRKQMERLAQERRDLDTAIQATNWATEIGDLTDTREV